MFRIESDQFARLRKHRLAEALAANLTGNLWHAERDPDNGDVLARDRLGQHTRFGFDAQGYVGFITSPLGRTWILHNGPRGRLDGLTSPAGLTLGYDYTQSGRLAAIRRDHDTLMRIDYDERGQTTALTWPDGSSTRFEYAGDWLGARTDRLGQRETYTYDGSGRLTAIADAGGHATHFDYDGWDRPARARFPDGRVQTYRYDVQGRLAEIADAAGPIASLAYGDDSLHPTHITYGDGEVLCFRYNAAGRVIAADSPDARATFAYGPDGALQRETLDDQAIDYRYDPRGSLVELRYPHGTRVGFGYDADARLSRLTDWTGGVSAWDYPHEQAQVQTFANGCRAVIRLGANGQVEESRLTDPAGALLAHSRFARDAEERLMTSEDLRLGRRDYRYDTAGQVVAVTATHPAQCERFAYDPAGNRIHCNGEEARFDAANRLLTQGATSCRYDARGDLVEIRSPRARWQLTWNRRGLLVGAVAQHGLRLDFGYDAFGRRVWKRVHESGGELPRITRYWWAGEHLIAELCWQGTRILRRQDYVFLPGSHTPFATRSDGRTYYYHCDPLGTPKRLTDGRGALAWEADYSAYGQTYSATGSVHNPWRFPGQYHDTETGIYYNRFRYYSPGLGRYLSPDPYGLCGGLNRYCYARCDPINRCDPLGLFVVALAIIAVVLIVASFAAGVTAYTLNQRLSGEEFCLRCTMADGLAQVGGFLTGMGAGLAEIVTGIADLGVGLWNLSFQGLYDQEGWASSWKNLGDAVDAIASSHGAILWDAFRQPYVDAWSNGRYGEAFGRGFVGVGEMLVGTKQLGKLGRASRMTKAERLVGRAVDKTLPALEHGSPFIGRLGGKTVELPHMYTRSISYTKRSELAREALRAEFNATKRKEFVTELATDSHKRDALRRAGLTDRDLARMQDGKIPPGWQVHHKLPLDDGGTNAPSNLVLIRNDPAHKVITNAQQSLVGDLAAGQTRTVDFPVPDGFVYPPEAGMLSSP